MRSQLESDTIIKIIRENESLIRAELDKYYHPDKHKRPHNALKTCKWGQDELSFNSLEALLAKTLPVASFSGNETRQMVEFLGYDPELFYLSKKEYNDLMST